MTLPCTTHQEIVRGDDYKVADGRALTWFSSEYPNLAGSSLTMLVGSRNPNLPGVAATPVVTWKGTIPAGEAIYVATLELSAAQTKEAAFGTSDYSLTATLANGDVVTLAIGQLTVQGLPGTFPSSPAP